MSDGWTKEQKEEFIENSRHAIDHLFDALDDYNSILYSNQKLFDLFMYRDQWSPNANYYYAQYLDKKQQEARIESMSFLAGALLQLARQILSMHPGEGKPNISGARNIAGISIVDVIWAGRNHAMHWEEGKLRQKEVFEKLLIKREPGKNYCLFVLGALGWKSSDDMIVDLKELIK